MVIVRFFGESKILEIIYMFINTVIYKYSMMYREILYGILK